MITNKDVRVENGNLILNGDKFPLDGQSPEAIMQIVEDNSDSTPTENSTAPISSGGVFAADKAISDTIGDITQTGVTGATVAAQLGAVADDISYNTAVLTTTDYPFLDADLNIYRFGKVVSLLFRGFKNLTANTETTIISALPSEFRPSETVHFTFLQGSSSFAMIRLSISSNGAVKVYPYGDAAVTGSNNMSTTITYVK